MKKADPPLSVHIPASEDDHPSWMRVGVIAVIGFAVGIAWPKVAGVKLGPNAPGASTATAEPGASASALAATAPPKARAPEAPTASLVAPAASAPTAGSAAPGAEAPPPVASANAPTMLTVKPGILLSCRTEAGETLKGKACGSINFDSLALPRLKKLASCPAAAGNEGKLSPTFHLDFNTNKLTVQMGAKNTVGNVDTFSGCLGGIFEKVSINAVTHEHVKYSILYNLTFAPGTAGADATAVKASGGKVEGTPAAATPTNGGDEGASGGAKIAWSVAVVRDAPRTGSPVGRLPRGTTVQILSTENNWYKVRAGTTEGWLYRGAIGR